MIERLRKARRLAKPRPSCTTIEPATATNSLPGRHGRPSHPRSPRYRAGAVDDDGRHFDLGLRGGRHAPG